MIRAIQFVGVVWLLAAATVCFAQKPPKNPPPPKVAPPPAAKPVPRPAGQPAPNNAGGVPKGPGMPNPNNPVFRLFRMTPEQRERALEKVPPKQQDNIRKALANFDSKPQAERDWELQRLNKFWSLAPDKQALVTQQIEAFKALSPDRVQAVRPAYVNLSKMTPEERADRLARPQFRARFSPAELQMLTVLPEYWPAPASRPKE